MELHDDPQRLVETFAGQHEAVLGEAHGDLAARLSEVPDRYVDQGSNPRAISVSCTLLETLTFSRWRRETDKSTLKVVRGNGFGILLVDGKGTEIPVRKYPRKRKGSWLEPVSYVPGGEQLSIEEELGHAIGDEEGIPEPQNYRLFVLWWPGSLGLGGAVLAAGVLTRKVKVLYATTPLPPPVMEDRIATIPVVNDQARAAAVSTPAKRRRDDDFGEADEGQEDASPQSS